jgi:hypothetical protein
VARGTEPGTDTLTNITKAGDGVAKDAAPSMTVVLSGTDVDISNMGRRDWSAGARSASGRHDKSSAFLDQLVSRVLLLAR